MTSIRGRLAPSPTGAQHVGNARTYLVAWLSARSRDGGVALRVEDLDSPRVKPGAADQAIDDLRWLGLDWDGRPVVQTKRVRLYTRALDELKRQGLVYPCTCTRGDVAAAASAPHAEHEGPPYPGTCAGRTAADAVGLDRPFAWRFRVTDSPTFDDLYAGPTRIDLTQAGGDFVVWKSGGTPAYQLAAVVDDAAMDVTEVIRGDDLIPSTPRQLLLYRALNLTPPGFAHVPLVVGADGRRLAKRHGDTRLAALRAAGVPPDALVGLLAWSCGWIDRIEPITPRDLIPRFRLDAIPPQPFELTAEALAAVGYRAVAAGGSAARRARRRAGEITTTAQFAGPVRPAGPTDIPSTVPRALGAETEIPPERLGPYRLVQVLGRGGMGIVYEAVDEQLNRRVALKVMAPGLAGQESSRLRFLREARSMAAVEHDHIVPVYGVGEADGRPFIAMPLLAGRTLDTRLGIENAVPVPGAVLIGTQIARALAAAHAKGLVHRDVKPSNIWLEADPDGTFRRVRLLDFGLSRAVGGAHLTSSGTVVGTPAYMAPEQARGKKVDHRADLFSLGCVLYRMVTGTPAFVGADPAAVLMAIANHPPPPASEVEPTVPFRLSALIDRLMAKDPAKRPNNAEVVADELERIGNLRPGSDSGTGLLKKMRSLFALNLGKGADDPEATGPAARPAANLPPTAQVAAWVFAFRGGTIDIRTPGGVRPAAGPEAVTDGGLAHTIAIPKAGGVTDVDLDRLRPLTRLRGLWLGKSDVTDAGVRFLTTLPLAKTLTVLGLAASRVTDAGVEYLRHFPSLTALDLSGTAVTAAGLDDLVLSNLLGQVKLARLRVREIGASRDEIRAVAERLPACAVESDYDMLRPDESA